MLSDICTPVKCNIEHINNIIIAAQYMQQIYLH